MSMQTWVGIYDDAIYVIIYDDAIYVIIRIHCFSLCLLQILPCLEICSNQKIMF